MTPVATVTLTGNPRTGELHLPAPRKPYLLWIEREGDDLRLVARGALPSVGTLRRVQPDIDGPLTYVGWVTIDLYQWKCVADEKVTTLEVWDTPQRREGASEGIAESLAGVFGEGDDEHSIG